MSFAEIVPIVVSVLMALLSVVLSYALQRSNEKRKKAEQATDFERQRRRDEMEELRSRVDAELISWGVRSIEMLSDAHILLDTKCSGKTGEVVVARRDEAQAHISALVDRGRLYFPNHSSDVDWPSWRNRPNANKGFRDPILDALMLAHEELRRLNVSDDGAFKAAARNTFAARRAFISELQDWIKPRKLGFGRVDGDKAMQSGRPIEKDWATVETLVDDFESRHGDRSFWGERPIPRSQLLAELERHRTRSAAMA